MSLERRLMNLRACSGRSMELVSEAEHAVIAGWNHQVRFVPPADSGLAIEWWDNQPLRRSANFFTVVSSEEPTTGIDAVLEPSP